MFNNDFYKKNEYHLTFFLLNNNCIEAIFAERISGSVEISAVKIYSDNTVVIDCAPYLENYSTVEESYLRLKRKYIDIQQEAIKAPQSHINLILTLINFALSNFSNTLIWEHAKAILES